jgi:hypothetical protein
MVRTEEPGQRYPETGPGSLARGRVGLLPPFHFSPHEEWGIYILVEPLLEQCDILYRSFGGKLAAFNWETLMGCVLFEVFHHELFHHLTECAATSWARPRRRVTTSVGVGTVGTTWATSGATVGVLPGSPPHRYGRRREVHDGEICPTA